MSVSCVGFGAVWETWTKTESRPGSIEGLPMKLPVPILLCTTIGLDVAYWGLQKLDPHKGAMIFHIFHKIGVFCHTLSCT